MRKARLLIAVCAGVLVSVVWLADRHGAPITAGSAGREAGQSRRKAPARPSATAFSADPAPGTQPDPPNHAIRAAADSAAEVLDRFTDWTRQYLAAEPKEKSRLIDEGVLLARERRPVFKQLIVDDPQRALRDAVPMVVRQQLPPEIVSLLEERVNRRADLRVYQGVPPPGEPLPTKTLTHRIASFKEGRAYVAHVYGSRAIDVLGARNDALNGVAIDNQFAVNDEPVRELEAGERPDPAKSVLTACPISGKQVVTDDSAGDPVPADASVVETPEEIVYLCGGYHKMNYITTLYAEGGTGGPIPVTGILPAAPTPALGMVKILYIPLTFQDQNAIPATESACYQVMRNVSDYYLKSSFGKLTTLTTVTPPIKLPKNEAWYVQRDTSNGGDIDGLGLEMTHAREEARRIGFDYNNYDCTVVRLSGGARPTGGWGGGGSVWVYSDSVGVCAHEIGHSFGLAHANFWDTSGTSAIGPGANAEYGDSYDVMGGGGVPNDHYNVAAKSQVKWLPDNFVQRITASGLYRLHAFDQPVLDPRNNYALTIVKDALRTYWGELRQNYTGSASRPWADQGMLLGWKFPTGSGSNIQLIDTTPGSPYAKDDAAIALGSTFGDTEAGIFITTVGVSTTTPKYVDVVVNMGSFAGNHAPALSLASSGDSVPAGATVTFTATASDADGDTLAYQWQHWGDTSVKIVSPNSPVITRTFGTAGSYVVSCTVSDMKGGTVTREKLIIVGSGNSRYTVNGRITAGGLGLPGVLVNANNTNPVITDADGYYTITNLAANTYSMTPLLYGYTFTELFNNSVAVGPNFTGADFEAESLPVVTITAPDAEAKENTSDTAAFRLTRTGDISQPLTVNVTTAQGTAVTGDYTLTPTVASGSPFNSFTIPADSATLDILVTPVNDSTIEGPETLIYPLAAGAGYLVGSGGGSATVTIDDDDTTLPKVGITATTADAIENTSTPGVFTVSRTGATTAALPVNYTVGGTAAAGADYTALPGSVTIPIGASSATIDVAATDDALVESLEAAVLTISPNAAYVINPAATNATVNIIDDDTNVVSVAATDATATEIDLSQPAAIADTGTFLVTRTGDTTLPLTVYYSFAGAASSGVPALNGVDFEALPGVVQIPAGSASASVTIVPRWDNLGESAEQLVLQLGAGPTNYKLGGSVIATITINDGIGNAPYIEVNNTSVAAEPATSGNFRFATRGGAGGPIVVHYTIGGMATNGIDYDGAVWAAKTSGLADALRGVWGSDANNVWAVGDGGAILKWDGSVWSAQTSNTTNTLRGVWGWDASNVWAVGDGGVILKWDGSVWSAQTSNTTNTLRGVWGWDASNVWAVGDGGAIFKWNGTAWSAQTSSSSNALYAAWGNASNSVWAVGAIGTVLKWNGSTWSAQTSGTTETLHSVWGAGPTSLWAAGNAGKILRSTNGTSWSAQTSGTVLDLNAIWGVDANILWASGSSGTILRTTNGGSTWTTQISNAVQSLNSLRGLDVNNVWAVGDGGAIVNWNTGATVPLSGTVIIPAGASTADLTVRPIDDALPEDLESIVLTVTPDAAYQTFGPTSSATMWLRDDEQPTVWVDTQVGSSGNATNRIAEGSSTSPVKFYVSRTGATTNALTVNFTLGGGATAGSDYTVTTSATLTFDEPSGTGVLTIPAGSQGANVPLSIVNDAVFEGTETVLISLAAGSYSTTLPATLYIDDNETSTQKVFFDGASASGSENAGSVTIPVNLTTAAAAPVSVEYVIDSGTRTSTSTTNNVETLPYWVRVVRTGTSLTFFQSNDGSAWTQRGSAVTVSMSSTSYLAGLAVTSGQSGTANDAVIDNVSITGLSAGGTVGAQTSLDIGTVNPAGTDSLNAGVYSISAGGGAITSGATTDGFHYVHFPVSNSANCTLTARVVSQSGSATLTRAGAMIRESTATNSRFAAGLAQLNGTFLQAYRSTTGGGCTLTSHVTIIRPWWLRLDRAGNLFTASQSSDGLAWTTVGTPQTLALSTEVLAGLAVSARSDGSLSTATFDNVSLTGSPALVGRTVGYVNAQGSESFAGGTWTVTGSGAQIGGSEDECHFVAAPVTGDFTLVARVLTQSGGANNAQAGVMARENGTHRVRNLYLGSVANAGTEFIYRNTTVTNAFGDGIDFTLNSGVLNFAIGESTKNIDLGIIDDSISEPDENVTIILRNPNGAQINTPSLFTYTIIDDDSPPPVPYAGFAAGATAVTEGSAGTVNLPVSLSAPAAGNVSVDYAVSGGTAIDGTDYNLAAGTLIFAPGELVKEIQLTVIDDSTVEGSETVTIALSNAAGANTGSLSSHTVTIADDDLPVVSIVANDPNASEAGLDPGQFTVSRTGATAGALTVNFTIATGTGRATSGTDFAGIGTSVSIPSGQSSAPITITPVQDSTNEGSETVLLTLSANAAYTVGTPNNAAVTIADDDRSTVSIVANDPDASETAGNPGQFTVTRTAPTTGSLTVTLSITGTATNTTDYANISTSLAFTASEVSKTINVTPVNDLSTEGRETVIVKIATGSGTYSIGGTGYDVVAIHDNDSPPTVYVTSPAAQGTLVPAGEGIVVSASVADDGAPQPVTLNWTQAAGPGTATFSAPTEATSPVTFTSDGVYALRITATDGQFTTSDQVTVIIGSAVAPADWIALDMSPSTQQRGQSAQIASSYLLTGMGAGYSGTSDGAHIMARQVTGDGSIVARLTATGGAAATPLAGVTIRDSLARACRRAVLGYVPGTGLQFRTRTTAGATDTVSTQSGVTLPVWVKLELAGSSVTATHAPDVGGAPGTWTQLGGATAIPFVNTITQMGLTATGNSSSAGVLCTAAFDNVSLTPAPDGPALVSEDFGTSTPTASTFSVNSGTYTIGASGGMDTTGAFYGWQYYGDLVITAKQTAATSGALNAKSGIMIRESMDNGGYIHLGRIPTGSFSGYIWRTLAGGSGGGVPSFTGAVRWMRLVRQGNRVTAFHAPDVSGNPGTWAQLGQPQTIIMSTPVLVGFAVDNAGGTAGVLNTATFNNLSIVPLNKAPTIDLSAVPVSVIGSINLDASVSDDGMPAPPMLTTQWSRAAGPGAVNFGDTAAVDTSATFSQFGLYTLRLQADDTGIVGFRDKSLTFYQSQFQQWQAQNFGGDPDDPDAMPDADPDYDGLKNITEYALGTNPNAADPSSGNKIITDAENVGGLNYLRLTISRNPDATDVQYEVEAAGMLGASADWNSAGLVTEVNTPDQLVVRDNVPIAPGVHRFMRLRVMMP